VLTKLSLFWFDMLDGVVENHFISADVADLPAEFVPYADELRGRFMLVHKATVFPVECIVRGYLAGSGWKEYLRSASVCGIPAPRGMQESEQLPEPLFTPSTKAEIGEHDENISFERMTEIIGESPAEELKAALDRRLLGGARARGAAGHHHRRHQVRVRAGAWAHHTDR
jgi:phosphoribosylaminoimidazole-succinocarboxamide synthase